MSDNVKVLITFIIEPDLIRKIEEVNPLVEVLYEPNLLGSPRYPCDQHGTSIQHNSTQKKRWSDLLSQTEVLFGYVLHTNIKELQKTAPRLKWVQSPSAGVGRWVTRTGFSDLEIPLTTASGIHATPLAEFSMMAMLWFVKDAPRMISEKERRHWERYAGTTLKGKTVAVISLGSIGQEVARLAKSFGMQVIGTKRSLVGIDPASLNAEHLYPRTDLKPMLAQADFVVTCIPHTHETEGLIGEEEFAAMKPGAVLINVARGSILDEAALIRALNSKHLSGAALDVQAKEPLPPDSPLWGMSQVLLSPHSGSNVDSENVELVKLFCDNLHRYLDGKPLRNVLDKNKLY
jgi:phosphoglycerate dehydrogenase-like enzyme